MRTWIPCIALLPLSLAVNVLTMPGAAYALDNIGLRGSDTLELVLNDLLLQCPDATTAGLTYRGGGSTTGENAMTGAAPGQSIAPMSRFLNPTVGVCAQGATAEGLVIGLDGIAVVAGATNANACGGNLAHTNLRFFRVTDANGAPVINCPGCDPGTNTYRISDWKDVLALVYAGQTHAASVPADCAGDVRRSLVDDWANLFEDRCSGGSCAKLKRAFRRADLSGTTDTFLALVGLPSMPQASSVSGAVRKPIAFCNAYGAGDLFGGDSDYLDNDPLRRPCDASEEVCSPSGDLGLVTVIEVPSNLTLRQSYPTQQCQLGRFRLLTPAAMGVTRCPNGQRPLFGKCFQPVVENADGTFTADCLARKAPVQGFAGAGMDGRAYNLYIKDANGSYRKDSLNRLITGAFYRLHSTTTIAPDGATCKQTTATMQLGCLVQANPCAIGFAGREAAVDVPRTFGLGVGAIAPTRANIENLVFTPTDPADDYPLARKLFLNTLVGFENVTGGELALAKCFADSTKLRPLVERRGFVPLPNGVFCEDFDESTCSGGPIANSNACANNFPPFPR